MTYTIEGFGAEQAIKGFPWLRYLGADPAAAVEQALAASREDEKLKEQLLELRD